MEKKVRLRMSNFEKIHQESPREKIYRIEKSDEDYVTIYPPPIPIPMKLEMPILEAEIEKSKSETVKKQPRKVPSKRNTSAMA